MSALTIANLPIRQDEAGRYCLNDLHRASGGEAKNQPANWLRMQQTQELAAEISREAIPQIRGIESKQGLGTFVAKELVYAYAMWISPAFHLKVIRAYDDLVTKPSGLNAGNLTRLELLQLAMQAEQERMVLESQVTVLQPKADALDRIANTDGSFCLTDAAKTLQVPPRQFTQRLVAMGWIYRRPQGAVWLAHQDKINALYLEHKTTTGEKSNGTEWTSTQVRVTAKGMARLAREFVAAGERHEPIQKR